ncbi:MAG: hypothetical protein ACR2H1_11630 [Limisphaerales bacterium]
MKFKIALIGLLLFFAYDRANAEASLSNAAPRDLKLFIDPSSAAVPGGKVNLSVGLLNLKGGNFVGDYHIKVVPYFFQNEKGKLTMTAPEESLRKLTNQIAVDFVGQAVSSSGQINRIDGKITPTNQEHGAVMLWFMSGKRKMIFQTTYHFGEK